MKNSIALFDIDARKLPIVKLSETLPILSPILISIVRIQMTIVRTLRQLAPSLMRNVKVSPVNWIIEQIGQVVKERLAAGKKRK